MKDSLEGKNAASAQNKLTLPCVLRKE